MNTNTIQEQFDSMESVIAYYWHYVEGFDAALSCDNPACPRHGNNTAADRQRIASHREMFLADLCQHIVNTYEQTGR